MFDYLGITSGVSYLVNFPRAMLFLILSTCLLIPYEGIDLSYLDRLLQNPADERGIPLWNHTYGGPENDWAQDIIPISGGGFALTGAVNNPGSVPVGDVFLLRTDEDGNQLWNKTYDVGVGGESIIEVSSGGFAIAAYAGWLIRTDVDGNLLWNRTFRDEFNELQVSSVIETRTGGFAMVGYQPGQGYDLSVVLVDSNGDLQYRIVYSGPSDSEFGEWGDDMGFDMIEHSTGGYVIAGTLDDQLALIRVDVVGNLMWRESYHRFGFGEGTSLIEAENGGILIAGVIDGEAHVIHTDSSGNVIWNESYGNVNSDVSLVRKIDGSIAISANRDIVTLDAAWIGRIDNNGTLIWDRSYPNLQSPSTVNALIAFGVDNFVLAGAISFNLQPHLETQIWILAISESPEPIDPVPVELLSISAVGIVVSAIALCELHRRKRLE